MSGLTLFLPPVYAILCVHLLYHTDPILLQLCIDAPRRVLRIVRRDLRITGENETIPEYGVLRSHATPTPVIRKRDDT